MSSDSRMDSQHRLRVSRTRKLAYLQTTKTYFTEQQHLHTLCSLKRVIKHILKQTPQTVKIRSLSEPCPTWILPCGTLKLLEVWVDPWHDAHNADYYFTFITRFEVYFIKIMNARPDMARGYTEALSCINAQARVADIDGVEIIEWLIGYEDIYGNNFFVSRWRSLPTLEEYLSRTEDDAVVLRSSLLKRVDQVIAACSSFTDLKPANMFYDDQSDTIILYDLYDRAMPTS